MSPHQIIAVAIRLFAIWLVIYLAQTAPSFFRETIRVDDPAVSVAIVVISILAVLLVLFLWFFPLTVARRLLDARNLAPAEPASPDTWFSVGCALIGIWLIIPALASLTYNLSVLYMAQRNAALETTGLHFGWIYYSVEIVFGAWLLLGARGARKLFWWARNGQ